MFIVLSLVWAAGPLVAALKLVDLSTRAPRPANLSIPSASAVRRDRAPLVMLMGAILLAMTTVNIGRLVLPLLMDSLQYSATSVTTANAVAGVVTLPFAYFLGRSLAGWVARQS